MSHIFISYSRKEIVFAQKIVDALAANNLDTWIDWKSIPKGEDWEQEIYRGIEEADAFLFLISPDSIVSQMCNKEIDHAVKNGKRILPTVVRDTDLKTIHPEISKRNWIFCRDGQDDFNKAIEETRTTIHTDYEWLKYHTELQVKALKWEQRKDTSRLLRGKELREAEQQLAEISSQEDPQPTKLQREYILASQRNEIRSRRQITIGLVAGLAIMTVLSFIAWGQRNEAQRQANIALAKGLAAQSKVLGIDSSSHFIQSSLLAIESISRLENLEASDAIRERIDVIPRDIIYKKYNQPILALAFNPTANALAIGTGNTYRDDKTEPQFGSLILISTKTYQEIFIIKFESSVTYIDFSLDGTMILTGNSDGIARVLDVTNGKTIAEIKYDSPFYGKGNLRFSPDGSKVAGTNLNYINVWESRTGKEVEKINFGYAVLDFSPDGNLIVAGDFSGKIIVWDINNKAVIMEKDLSPRGVNSIEFSKDSKSLIVNSGRNNLLVLKLTTEKDALLYGIAGVTQTALSSDGSRLAYHDTILKRVVVLNTSDWKPILELPNISWLLSLSFGKTSNMLVTTESNGLAIVWNLDTLEPIIQAPLGDKSQYSSIAINQNNLIAAGSNNGIVAIFNSTNANEIARVDYGRIDIGLADWMGSVNSVDISPDGKFFVSSSTGKSELVDIRSQKTLLSRDCQSITSKSIFGNDETWVMMCNDAIISLPDLKELSLKSSTNTFSDLIVSTTGNLAAYSNGNDTTIWDIRANKEVTKVLNGKPVKFSPNGKLLVVEYKSQIRLIESITGKMLGGIDNKLINYSISPNNKFLLAAYDDGVIDVWDISSGNIIFEHQEKTAHIYSIILKFNADDNKILVVTSEGIIELWDIQNDQTPLLAVSQEDAIHSAIFSSSGKYIVTGSENGSVRVFNSKSGQELARMYHNDTGLENYISDLAISYDDKYIASGSYDGTARVWLWQPEDLISQLCSRLPRNLTQDEWQKYFEDELYRQTCANLPDLSSEKAPDSNLNILQNSNWWIIGGIFCYVGGLTCLIFAIFMIIRFTRKRAHR